MPLVNNPLTDEEQRRIQKHLRYPQVSRIGAGVGAQILSTEYVNLLQYSMDALTPAGQVTVREQLAVCDRLLSAIETMDIRFQADKVGSITLNKQELEVRNRHYDEARERMAMTLFASMDPPSRADGGGGATSMFEGPFREP